MANELYIIQNGQFTSDYSSASLKRKIREDYEDYSGYHADWLSETTINSSGTYFVIQGCNNGYRRNAIVVVSSTLTPGQSYSTIKATIKNPESSTIKCAFGFIPNTTYSQLFIDITTINPKTLFRPYWVLTEIASNNTTTIAIDIGNYDNGIFFYWNNFDSDLIATGGNFDSTGWQTLQLSNLYFDGYKPYEHWVTDADKGAQMTGEITSGKIAKSKDIIDLRNGIYYEFNRRDNPYHDGTATSSLASYAPSDFISSAAVGSPITIDQAQKTINKMLIVNDYPYLSTQTQNGQIFSNGYVGNMIEDIKWLGTLSKTGISTGCKGACTGLCLGTCYTGCDNGCTNSVGYSSNCTGNCTGNCTDNCAENCKSKCSGTCTEVCSGCGSSCWASCGQSCQADCGAHGGPSCAGYCGAWCSFSCISSCGGNCDQGCYGSCAKQSLATNQVSPCSECSYGCKTGCTGHCSNLCTGTAN